jgi:uncharacterized membrane protein
MNPFRRAQLGWDIRGSLLVRPFAVMIITIALAEVLPALEADGRMRLPTALAALLATEPGSAQVVLATMAGSMITVVSVVYTILVVALTLASIQFSPRILSSFLRHTSTQWTLQFSPRILSSFLRHTSTQWTLGLVVGTFAYCVLLLRSLRLDPPFVPMASLTLAVALVLASLSALVWFIHHIANGIQANHLVDRLAAETEPVVDEVWTTMPQPEAPSPTVAGTPIQSNSSGYVQLIDTNGLRRLASRGLVVIVERGMGRFVRAGAILARIDPPAAATPDVAATVRAAFDLGPVRTFQEDIEWGFRQIVDIALKAISPAINDPSTAATCIDHLTRLLTRALGRFPPPRVEQHGRGVLVLPHTTAVDLVDLAFEQLRQYSRNDMAVSLRLLRAFAEVGQATADAAVHDRLKSHARLLETAVRPNFAPGDCDELDRRLAAVAALGTSPL